jgi:putative flippase GtrA
MVEKLRRAEPMTRDVHSQFFLFSLSGVAGFVFDASIVWALTYMAIDAIVAQGVAFSVAVTVTWWLNRKFTFSHLSDHHVFREWLRYISANSVGAIVNNGLYVILVLSVSVMTKHPVFAVAIGSLAGLSFNFTASRLLVFRR